jgi:beta-phosphoglucomutase-like phosphatase (HAD superfamily)
LFPHAVGREAQVSHTHNIESSIRRLIAVLVEELKIRDFFKIMVSGYDMLGKPNPDVFQRG